MPKPRKLVKTLKQLDELDVKKLPNKPSWMDKEDSEPNDDEAFDRDLVDLMRGKYEGE